MLLQFVEAIHPQSFFLLLGLDPNGGIVGEVGGNTTEGGIKILAQAVQCGRRDRLVVEDPTDVGALGLPRGALEESRAEVAPAITGRDEDIVPAELDLDLLEGTEGIGRTVDLTTR